MTTHHSSTSVHHPFDSAQQLASSLCAVHYGIGSEFLSDGSSALVRARRIYSAFAVIHWGKCSSRVAKDVSEESLRPSDPPEHILVIHCCEGLVVGKHVRSLIGGRFSCAHLVETSLERPGLNKSLCACAVGKYVDESPREFRVVARVLRECEDHIESARGCSEQGQIRARGSAWDDRGGCTATGHEHDEHRESMAGVEEAFSRFVVVDRSEGVESDAIYYLFGFGSGAFSVTRIFSGAFDGRIVSPIEVFFRSGDLMTSVLGFGLLVEVRFRLAAALIGSRHSFGSMCDLSHGLQVAGGDLGQLALNGLPHPISGNGINYRESA